MAIPESNEPMECAGCGGVAAGEFASWYAMERQSTEIEDLVQMEEFLAQAQGRPFVVRLPDEGGVEIYAILSYCDDCLEARSIEYEENNTPEGQTTSRAFYEEVAEWARQHDWQTYALSQRYLAPRGVPNIVLVRGDRVIFTKIEGDVSVRFRESPMPDLGGCTILTSPEVPPVLSALLHSSEDEAHGSISVAFLYMDEKYLDAQADPCTQVTLLGGLMIDAVKYPTFRDRMFGLLPNFDEGPEAFGTEVHAGDLFRDLPDEQHFAFYDGLVALINEFDCKIYSRGFNFVPGNGMLRTHQQDILAVCFRSMLISVDNSAIAEQVWPVMEIDHSKSQDEHFAGFMRWMSHATTYLEMTGDGVQELIHNDYMVDTRKVGDIHYVGKRSIIGNAVDCITYLLHHKWLNDNDYPLTDYKRRLATIATGIRPGLINQYIARYRLREPNEIK